MKTREIPLELRGFHKIFTSIGRGKWNYSEVFDDFLTLAMCCYAWETEEPLYFQTIKKYDREELNLFAKLLAEWVLAHNKYYQAGEWVDLLGTYYEILKSDYKAKALGQYFTPKPICDMMATFMSPSAGESVNDCCCGSGRMLLAANALRDYQLYTVGQDLDRMCAKMSCLNLMIHGIKGHVQHMDSLAMKVFTTWSINPTIDKNGLFCIVRVKEEEQKRIEPKGFELSF